MIATMALRIYLVLASSASAIITENTFAADNSTEYLIRGTGLSAEDELLQGNDTDFGLTALSGRCTEAGRSDLLRMHNNQYWVNKCEAAACRGGPGWSANGVNYFGYAPLCIEQGGVHISSPTIESVSTTLARKSVINPSSVPLTSTFTLSGDTTEGLSASVSATVSIEQSYTVEVGLPGAMQVGSQTTIGLSVTGTHTTDETHRQGHELSGSVTVPPNTEVCVKMEVDVISGVAQFEVPVCLRGYIRCEYGWRCNGHYYWFAWQSECHPVTGTVRSRQGLHARLIQTDGRCERDAPGVQLADLVIGEGADEVGTRAFGQHVPVAACVASAAAVFLLMLGVQRRLRRDTGRLEERLLA